MTQIIKLNAKSAVIRLHNGNEKKIAVKKDSHVEDVVNYLNNQEDIKAVFEYYLKIFNSELLQKRFKVYCPSKKELAQRKVVAEQHERYYQSWECEQLLKENEKEVKRYIATLPNLK